VEQTYSGLQTDAICVEMPRSIVFALKARRKLAGGGAQRNHRNLAHQPDKPRQGRQTEALVQRPLPGRKTSLDLIRLLRWAPPPANFRRPCRGEEWKRPHSLENRCKSVPHFSQED
jgi:hypothetical protein